MASGSGELRRILDAIGEPVFVKDSRHRWVDGNAAWARLVRIPDWLGRTDSDLFPPDQVEGFWRDDRRVFAGATTETAERIGDSLTAITRKFPLELPGGERGLVGIIFDVTAYRRLLVEAEALRVGTAARSQFEDFIEGAGMIAVMKDEAGRYLMASPEFHRVFGLPPGAAAGRTDSELFSAAQAETARALAHPDPAADGILEREVAIVDAEGRTRSLLLKHFRLIDAATGAPTLCCTATDVTRLKAVQAELARARDMAEEQAFLLLEAKTESEHAALQDPLTGLANRRHLERVLEPDEARRRWPQGCAILHIDLDRFKQINDTLGHAAGDFVLIHVAGVLRTTVRSTDFVARIGGDEFVIVCAWSGDRGPLAGLASRIVAALQQPVRFAEAQCRFGASIGVAVAPPGLRDYRELVINADYALYRAKANGRNRAEFFTDGLAAEMRNHRALADDILRGLEAGEFVPVYQPQFDARTLAVDGLEALARWQHPRQGLLAPKAFLRAAEDLGVQAEIDRQILERALADRAAWTAAGLRPPRLSVNVSFRRLGDPALHLHLRSLRFEPGTLAFELVESIFLDERDDTLAWNIDRIRECGIGIEIDDFGTGFASIVALNRLRPDRLKIDRQLVLPITEGEAQRRLVAAIVEMGAALGIGIVAEGVETMAHAAILAEIGCGSLQGYALSRPLGAEAMAALLAAPARDAAAG